VHRDKFLIIKPTKCINFSNLFLEWNSTCFGQFLYPSSGVFHCRHSNGVCHTGLLTACEQDQDDPSWKCTHHIWKGDLTFADYVKSSDFLTTNFNNIICKSSY